MFITSCQEIVPEISDTMSEKDNALLKSSVRALNQFQADELVLNAAMKSGKSAEVTLTKSIEFKRSAGTFGIVENTGFCDAFQAPYQLVIEGSGIATHLGLITVRNLACLDQYGQYASPVYGFITAACGSEIHTMMDYAYPDEENPPNWFYHYTIIGGTEQYRDASGYFLMYGFIDDMSGTWSLTGEGRITY